MTFYERVYKTAKQRGMSIKQLSQKMGVSDATIYTWKKTGAPTGKNLTLVAKTLGVSVDYLLGNTDTLNSSHIQASGLSRKNSEKLLEASDGLSQDEMQQLISLAEFMKQNKK